jgi:hypothetical protein
MSKEQANRKGESCSRDVTLTNLVRLLDGNISTQFSTFMGLKRSRDEAMGENKPEKREKPEQPASPFMPMFESFRKDLDEHHDRRERIIKASRDITAASKKMFVISLLIYAMTIY